MNPNTTATLDEEVAKRAPETAPTAAAALGPHRGGGSKGAHTSSFTPPDLLLWHLVTLIRVHTPELSGGETGQDWDAASEAN